MRKLNRKLLAPLAVVLLLLIGVPGGLVVARRLKSADAALLKRAAAAAAGGRDAEAAILYKQTLEANPNSWQAHFGLARLSEAKGNLSKALKHYLAAARSNPRKVELLVALGTLSEKLQLWRPLEAAADRLLAIQPQNPTAHYWKALALRAAGQRDRAIEQAQQAVELDPDHPQSTTLLASLYCEARRYEVCERFLRRALANRPKDPDILTALAQLYQTRHDGNRSLEKARAFYEQAVRLAPDATEPRLGLARLLAAQGKLQEAQTLLSQARKHDPADKATLLLYCRLLLARGQTQQARALLAESLEKAPHWAAGRALLVEALLGSGKVREARQHFDQLPPGAGHTLKLIEGRLLRAEGRFAEAAEALRTAIALAPRSAAAHFELGITYKALGLPGEARACFENATRLSPDSTHFQRELANAALAAGRFRQALEAATTVLASKPDDQEMALARARALTALGRQEEAARELERQAAKAPDPKPFLLDLAALHLSRGHHYDALRAIARVPRGEKSWRVHSLRARVFGAMGHHREAEKELLKACDLAPDQLLPRKLLARLYRAQGLQDKAERVLRHFVATHPEDSDAHLALAIALARSGKSRPALDAARRALQTDPGNPAAAEVLVGLLLATHKPDEARKVAESAAAAMPGRLRAALLVPRVLLATGKAAQAASRLEKLVARYPNEATAAYFLGRAQAEQKALTAAITHFRKAVALRPGWLAARYALATACFEAGRFDEAIAECERLRQLSPGLRQAHFLSAFSHAHKEDYATAIEEYLEARPQNPTPSYYLGLANLLAKAGRHDEAERSLRRARELAPTSPTLLFALVSHLETTGKWKEAETEIGKLPGNDPFAVALLARHYQRAGRLADAEKAYSRLVQLAGNKPWSHILRGDFLLGTGRHDQACTEYQRAVDLGEKRARNFLASALTAAGKLDKARKHIATILDHSPRDARAHLERARLLLAEVTRDGQLEKLDDARSAATKALELDPSLLEAHLALADAMLLEKPPKRLAAVAELKRALAARPDYIPARLRLAQLHLDLGNGPAAEKEARRVLAAEPCSPQALESLWAALRRQSPTASALDLARQLAAEFPRNPARHFILGRALAEQGRWADAADEFRACLREAPLHLDARFALAHAMVKAGKAEQAVQDARRFAQHNKTNPTAWQLLGAVLRSSARPAEAATAFAQATRLAPRQLRFASLAAHAYHDAGDDRAALQTCRDYISHCPRDPRGHVLLGRVLLMANRPEEATEAFSQALRLAPNHIEALRLLVRTAARQGRFQRGIRACKTFLKAEPQSAQAWHLLGRLHFLADHLNEAQMAFARATKLNPQDPAPLLDLGSLFIRRHRHDRAISCLEKVIALDPDHPQANNNLAWALAEANSDLEKAKRLAVKATTLAPQDPSALDTLGWVCYKRREYDEAITALERSLRLRPDSATTHYHLAVALCAAGKPAEGSKHLRAALRSQAQFPEKEQAQRLLDQIQKTNAAAQQ